MDKPVIRIATRKSALAMWQAEHVATRLRKLHLGLEVQLIGMSTQGDKILDTPLALIGGKGLFVKELEHGLLENQVDIAVHSMKDVPVELPEGLHLAAILTREDPLDAFVSNKYANIDALPQNSTVGTASLRRECQLRAYRPDLNVLPLRGNVNTRLQRLDEGRYDAIILACAGLKRLGFETRISCVLSPEQSLPAIGQGAIGIECRVADMRTNALIAPLLDPETSVCVNAERALNQRLQGGCQVPIAGYAVLRDGSLYLRGLVGTPNGQRIIRADGQALPGQAEELGAQIADALLAKGASIILADIA